MQMGMKGIFNFEKEAKDAEQYPFIRLFSAWPVTNSLPQEDVQVNPHYIWTKPSLESLNLTWLDSFSAVW
jgi:hypothetical protein